MVTAWPHSSWIVGKRSQNAKSCRRWQGDIILRPRIAGSTFEKSLTDLTAGLALWDDLENDAGVRSGEKGCSIQLSCAIDDDTPEWFSAVGAVKRELFKGRSSAWLGGQPENRSSVILSAVLRRSVKIASHINAQSTIRKIAFACLIEYMEHSVFPGS